MNEKKEESHSSYCNTSKGISNTLATSTNNDQKHQNDNKEALTNNKLDALANDDHEAPINDNHEAPERRP